MATIKAVVLPAKARTNGKHKIRIAIAHRSETRYIVTRYELDDPSQIQNGQVIDNPDATFINAKLRAIVNSYLDALDKINVDAYTPKQLLEYLKTIKQGSTSFSVAASQYIDALTKDGRKSTAYLYQRTADYFVKFCGYDILLDGITPRTIKDFDTWMAKTKNLADTTRGTHFAHLKAIINQAKRDRLVRFDTDPFEYYERPATSTRELDISVEELRIIRDSQPKEKSLIVARDLFMLSYYLGGINMIDLLAYDFKGKKVLEYVRKKSAHTKKGEAKVSFSIQPEAKEIIDRYIGENGKLNFGYKLSYENFRKYMTASIARLAESIGLDSHVVYYSARKSFVQHGFELGIPLETLEYCIGQTMKANRPIFNYLKIMRKHADVAIRTIIDNLNAQS